MPVKGEDAMDENRIRQRAYELWEKDGRPEGRHAEHWERARRELGKVADRITTVTRLTSGAVRDLFERI